jgi:creatinine amidohydrolase
MHRGVRWEEQTPGSLERLRARSGGVCLLPLGVIEPHGEHLPLGTDALRSHALCERAAQRAPAAVFPPVFLGAIPEGRYVPGTIAIPVRLALELLEATADEIARNGFGKILIVNGHGGHRGLIGLWFNRHLESGRSYCLYLSRAQSTPGLKDRLYKSKQWEHACEHETSLSLELHPHLVDLAAVPCRPGVDHPRAAKLKAFQTPLDWYIRQPGFYSGDARASTAENGRLMAEDMTRNLAGLIRQVRRDRLLPQLQREFKRRVGHLAALRTDLV